MKFIRRLLNTGVIDSDSLLQKKGKQIYNFDIFVGILLPFCSELSLHLTGNDTPTLTFTNFIFSLSFLPHLILVRRKHYSLSVIIFQINSYLLIGWAVFITNNFLTSLFAIVLALNVFIYFPDRKKVASGAFLFFALSSVAFLSWEMSSLNTKAIDIDFLARLRISFSIFAFILCYKVFSLIILYWTSLFEKDASKAALVKSEARYRSFFEKVNIGIVMGSNGKIVRFNPAFCSLLGYSETEIMAMKHLEFIHPEDIELVKEFVRAAAKKPFSTAEFTHRVIKKDGKILNVLVTLAYFEGNNNEVVVTVVNLTPIRKAEEAMIETEDRYRSLFENALDGLFIFDLNKKKAIHCNPKMATILGIENPRDITRISLYSFLPEFQPGGTSSLHLLRKQFEGILSEGKAQFTIVGKKFDGTAITAAVNSFILPEPNNHLAVSFFRDITAQKKQEAIIQQNILELNQKNADLEKYIESNMQLENFAHIASHDLKAPIRTIGSFAQLLKRKASSKLDEPELQYLDFIAKGATNMQTLVDDLLAYSKVNTEQQQFKVINLPLLLEILQKELSSTIQENNAVINLQNIPPTIYADKTKIRQLFQNLISNAIKFKNPDIPPLIEIKAQQDQDFWHFSITDNGIGIKPEFHDKVFLLFRKLHGSSKYEGSGIGLSLCKKIVEQHDGIISIESEHGAFTRFDFSIRKIDVKDQVFQLDDNAIHQ